MDLKKINKTKFICTIGFLLIICTISASATPDAIIDRSRTQFPDISASTISYINSKCNDVKSDLFLISDISSITDYQTGASSDTAFVDNIDLLDDTTTTNVVLIHSHGDTFLLSSFIKFKDDSKLYDNEVTSGMDSRNSGFIFAGACSSAKYTDLGNSFINKGFDTYFGYKETVYTLHNALFYSEFFDLGTFTNVPVSTAASYAADETKEEYGDDTSVANYRLIGDSTLCLRT
ncbi:hypothetical protein [Methanococcoides burtonii]|uniref:Gingipain domain-containing protein n=1 Tax=Methanococcoides burtonii (strain DSM 6242 / NBRC 107633 / OCM 468 / ACE-M) TaxID=259564 RepID=Q12ZE7_METBU|nr:hypothetical protein [Methanococcoides burtonii]ABE51179.1 Hypothetical protein Mbur_0168 [Methanococcoides burtonii DSM 6242]